jgi:DNA uptake protein ComE-like DNA-binding protein
VARRVTLGEPPAGNWYLTLMLREWTAASTFLTRDYCTFATPYVGPARPVASALVPEASPSPALAGGDHAPIDAVGPSPAALEATSAAKPAPAKPAPAPAKLSPAQPAAVQPSRAQVSPAQLSPAQPSPSRPQEDAPPAQLVSVRRASVEQLLTVPGLNRKLAAAVVRGRPYASLDELTRIRGIGDRLLQKLKRHLTL